MGWTIKDIENLIENNAEESINLDFKAAGALGKSDKKKSEISKDVSSFANSNGGVIIYGLEESNHVAAEFSYINGNEYTKEWLEQVINSGIFKKIDGITIHPLRHGGGIERSVYVVEIPESLEGPHMAKDRKFYKRFNFESVPMEEYEIRRLYFQPNKTSLEIGKEIIGVTTHNDRPTKIIGISFGVKIKNIGRMIEKTFKVQIDLPIIQLLPVQSEGLMEATNNNKTHQIFSSSNKFPLFQNEEIIIDSVSYNFENHNIEMINKDLDIKVTLYFSSGIQRRIFKLNDVYKKAMKIELDSADNK